MPIVRSYMCPQCSHHMEVTLRPDQWDDPAPECPQCAARVNQDFKPVAIGGSPRRQAVELAERIASEDYHVADMKVESYEGTTPKVRYKEPPALGPTPTNWGAAGAAFGQALQAGRESRLRFGNPLDAVKNLPDPLVASKAKCIKVY